MSNLQPLVWQDLDEDPMLAPVSISESPLHHYVVLKDGEGIKVRYSKKGADFDYATGFATIDEAKQWAWNHYNEKMQPYVKPDSITDIANWFNNFTQWSYDRQIIQNGNVLAQGLKLVSEVGELADNLAKGRDIKDDIGDCMVVLNNLVHMTGVTLDDCLAQAWGDIKDRKGAMSEHGIFIKEGDNK